MFAPPHRWLSRRRAPFIAARALTNPAGRRSASCLVACAFGGPAQTLIVFLILALNVARADEPSVLDGYPGRLVSIGTHALHLDCRGEGGPLIVLESGLGGQSLEWYEVRRRLGPGVRVCAYDRAGYGWSESGPLPRTASRNARELHALLLAAGEHGPWVVVGHSYGGLIARLFAERYADETDGVVLLDASAPEQFVRLPASALPRVLLQAMHDGARTFSVPRPNPAVPESLRTTAQHLLMLPKARRAYASELRTFEASAAEVARQRDGALSMPLIVVSRARSPFAASAEGTRSERIWHEMQHQMTALSRRSDHWIAAGTGHVVHADRPELVVLAVREAARGATSAPTYVGDPPVRLVLSAYRSAVAVRSAPEASTTALMTRL